MHVLQLILMFRFRLRRRGRVVQLEKLLQYFTCDDVRDVLREDFRHEFKNSGVKRNHWRHQEGFICRLRLLVLIILHRVVVVIIIIIVVPVIS